ncbi:DUF6266 family protein [Pedobacter steynii]
MANGVLRVKWENGPASALCNDTDLATFIVYNETKEQFVTFQNVTERAANEVSLQMPKNFANDAVHCYMYYINAFSNVVSSSLYVGEAVVV